PPPRDPSASHLQAMHASHTSRASLLTANHARRTVLQLQEGQMHRCFGVLVIIGSILCSVPAGAQSGQGSLNGYVKDQQGGVLPGVTVTATGPALLAPVVAVTDNAGFYRLQNLPPGTLTVSAELSGFSTFRREGILMRAGSTFTVDIEMKVGALE